MPMLKERIQTDLKEAMRNRNEVSVGALRMLIAAITNWEKAKGRTEAAGDEDILVILRTEVKKRREAEEAFRAAGRAELADKEAHEADVLSAYLPAQMPEDEVRAHLQKLVDAGATEFGSLMKEAMKDLRNTADAAVVSRIAKEFTA